MSAQSLHMHCRGPLHRPSKENLSLASSISLFFVPIVDILFLLDSHASSRLTGYQIQIDGTIMNHQIDLISNFAKYPRALHE